LSGGIKIELSIPGRDQYLLDILVDGQSIKQFVNEPRHQHMIEEMFLFQPLYVPPAGVLSSAELFLLYPALKQKLDQGLSSECWRSNLYWIYNDGDKERFQNVVDLVERYIPNSKIQPPKLTHDNQSRVLIEFQQDEVSFDIGTSGGGLRSMLNLATVLHLSDAKCFLLDEPDTQLHGTLQQQIAQMVVDYAFENSIQIFATSHAPDFISEIPIESLYWIDRNSNAAASCDQIGRFLTELGAVTKVDALRKPGANKILFIEGSLDKSVLKQFAAHLCSQAICSHNPFADSSVIIAELPNGKGDRQHLSMFQKLLNQTFGIHVKVACIVDKDYDMPAGTADEETGNKNVLLYKLREKEIENYLVEPSILFNALRTETEKRNIHTQEQAIPTLQEVQTTLLNILNEPEVRDQIKYQVVAEYKSTLDNSLHPATKDRQGEEWFAQQWEECSSEV
jgi:predicted ATP-dependent endonuclease of OLD family